VAAEVVGVRIGLHDDVGQDRCAPARGAWSIPLALDGDLGPRCGCPVPVDQPVVEVPTASLRRRSRLYYDAEGTPTYDWSELGEGPIVLSEDRTELNDATGQTKVVATAEVSWADSLPDVDETAVLWTGGLRYEVTSAVRAPGRLKLTLERLSDVE
jgi:hypothetical protein